MAQRSGRPYTTEELDGLYHGFMTATSLFEMEDILGRGADGILLKLSNLSKADPEKWDPDILSAYKKEHYEALGKWRMYVWRHDLGGNEHIRQNSDISENKERKRRYGKEYRAANRDRENERRRIKYHEGGRKEWEQEYRRANREKLNKMDRVWYWGRGGKERRRQRHLEDIERYRAVSRHYRERTRHKYQDFGDYLAELLEGYHGSKKDFSIETGIHPSLLSHYLAGNRKPSEEFLRKVSEKFGVAYETLYKHANPSI